TYRFLVRVANTCGAALRPMTLVVAGAPILVLQAETLEFRYRRGGPVPAPQALLVNGTWPNRAYYIDQPDAPWLHAVPGSGRIPRLGAGVESDRVEVSGEPNQLAPAVMKQR